MPNYIYLGVKLSNKNAWAKILTGKENRRVGQCGVGTNLSNIQSLVVRGRRKVLYHPLSLVDKREGV